MMAPMLVWIIFAVMTAAGMAAVLLPLLRQERGSASSDEDQQATHDVAIYRDQLQELERDLARGVVTAGDAETARREISRRLLAADSRSEEAAGSSPAQTFGPRRLVAAATVILMPAFGLGVYLNTGSPGLPDQPLVERLAAPVADDSMPALIARVEAHLRKEPADVRGWTAIAPVYMRLQRFAEAAEAYRQVVNLGAGDHAVYANFGEALMLSQDGLITADARVAFNKANQLAPDEPKPRYFLALADYQDGRKTEAVAAWQALLAEAPADAPWRGTVEAQIASAVGSEAVATVPALSKETIASAEQMSGDDRQQMIEGMVERLSTRLREEGGKIEEWLRLARSQSVLGRKADAGKTLATARTKFAEVPDAIKQIDEMSRALNLDSTQ